MRELAATRWMKWLIWLLVVGSTSKDLKGDREDTSTLLRSRLTFLVFSGGSSLCFFISVIVCVCVVKFELLPGVLIDTLEGRC